MGAFYEYRVGPVLSAGRNDDGHTIKAATVPSSREKGKS